MHMEHIKLKHPKTFQQIKAKSYLVPRTTTWQVCDPTNKPGEPIMCKVIKLNAQKLSKWQNTTWC